MPGKNHSLYLHNVCLKYVLYMIKCRILKTTPDNSSAATVFGRSIRLLDIRNDYFLDLVKLAVREVHFRVLGHERLESILLFLFVTGGKTHLLKVRL